MPRGRPVGLPDFDIRAIALATALEARGLDGIRQDVVQLACTLAYGEGGLRTVVAPLAYERGLSLTLDLGGLDRRVEHLREKLGDLFWTRRHQKHPDVADAELRAIHAAACVLGDLFRASREEQPLHLVMLRQMGWPASACDKVGAFAAVFASN